MGIRVSVSKIAEAVIRWENRIDPDYCIHDESYDDQSYEFLYSFLKAVNNFSLAFEVEFEEIFTKHCNENMSEEQFLNFLEPRIKLLGQSKGNFSYVITCFFVREIIYRFKITFECFHFATAAQNCLAEFLESKFQEFEIENTWKDLLNYCNDINIKFYQLGECIDSSSQESTTSIFTQIPLIDKDSPELSKAATEINKNESFNSDKTINKSVKKLDFSDIGVQSVRDKSVHTISDSCKNDKYADNFFRENLNMRVDLSKDVCEISKNVDTEQGETNEHILSDDSNPSESSNGAFQSEETELSWEKDLEEIYDIIMPDIEGRSHILHLIEKCESFLDRPDSDEFTTKVDKNCDLKSEEHRENSVNRVNFCLRTGDENEKAVAPLFDASLENASFVTGAPRRCGERYCYQCKMNVQED